jgi:hypothetical protein
MRLIYNRSDIENEDRPRRSQRPGGRRTAKEAPSACPTYRQTPPSGNRVPNVVTRTDIRSLLVAGDSVARASTRCHRTQRSIAGLRRRRKSSASLPNGHRRNLSRLRALSTTSTCARLAKSPPIFEGVRVRPVMFPKSDADFYSWLQGIVGEPLVHRSGLRERFSDITARDRTYSLSLVVVREVQALGRLDPSQYVGLPPVPPGWVRYHLYAHVRSAQRPEWRRPRTSEPDGEATWGWSALVCLITLRSTPVGGLTGNVEYLDMIEPWVEALCGESADGWREAEAPSGKHTHVLHPTGNVAHHQPQRRRADRSTFTKNDLPTIGKKIRELYDEIGRRPSQIEVAECLGRSRSTVGRFFDGPAGIDWATFVTEAIASSSDSDAAH